MQFGGMYNQLMLSALTRPVVFAHRGASAHAPENTLAAFELALTQGADAIELDAKLSADGKVVVFHDFTLDRTTDGTGRLAQKKLADLRALDAGSHFSAKYQGEKIPLLEEVFDAVGKKLFVNVHLNNRTTPRDQLVDQVCKLVKNCGLEDRVLFSSFSVSNLERARQLLPVVPRGLLAAKHWMGAWARSFGFAFGDYVALHPYIADVDAREVRRVHRLKRTIHVWTVNKPEDLMRLKSWGADGIFTDDPALALRVLGRRA
jgi:glycerophosphoryl diester phosphodiesterase